jgi:Phage-integrase repeat unit
MKDNDKNWRKFEESRAFVHTLGLKSQAEWASYHKSGDKPSDIPSNPNRTYKNEWKGMGDWLGTGAIAPFEMQFRSFEEARQYVHTLGLKNHTEWINYCKSGNKPTDIPSGPNSTYEKEWKSWDDWLGTGYIAASKKEYRTFEEAKQYVHSLHLKSQKEWRQYIRSGNKPTDIPTSVQEVYI